MTTEAIYTVTQYLSFSLADEIFALDITRVREVIEFTEVTKVPQTPDFVRGIINLRGGVVPVVDLKQKFGLGETAKTVNTCVIIAEVIVNNESIILGAMADDVDEVFDLSPESIEPAPRIGTQMNTDFLNGMGKKDEEFVLLLNIDKVFSEAELEQVAVTGENPDDEPDEQDA